MANYHNIDECPPNTQVTETERNGCTLIQSYFEIFLKDFIYAINNREYDTAQDYIRRVQTCLEARINEAIKLGTASDMPHFNVIMDTLLFYTLLNDIIGGEVDHANNYLNSLVRTYGINGLYINGNRPNIDFATTQNNLYGQFLDIILDYNRDRPTLPCINNNIVMWYNNIENVARQVSTQQIHQTLINTRTQF